MSGETDQIRLWQIVAALAVTYTDAGIAMWLRSPNARLFGMAPIDALAADNPVSVADAVARIGDCDPRDITGGNDD
jgi:hypothetical protein